MRNLLFIGFLLLGFWYSMATPPFETPDELYHYAFVRHIAQGNWLPVQQADVESPWEQEGSQAPLYYLLVGWLTSGIDQSDFAAISIHNPRANIGDPLFPGNKNFMLYSAAIHPLRGANLALHIGRWVSLMLGVVTLWCTYATAKLAFEDRPRLGGSPKRTSLGRSVLGQPPQTLFPFIITLWVAAIPQFAFISASCSNDSLIIATAAATVYWLARLAMKATKTKISRQEWLFLGILLALAALSKLQGLGLVGLAGLVVLWLTWQQRDWRLLLRAALFVAVPALIIAGWWYGRNIALYGDLFGTSHLLANNGLRSDELTWPGLWGELRGLRYSFWGLFGWFNLLLPTWIYALLDGLTLVALLGLLVRPLLDRLLSPLLPGSQAVPREQIIRTIALSWVALSLLLLAYWISQATGSQGRLLFPAIGAIIYLIVDGLRAWVQRLPRPWQLLVWFSVPSLLLGASLYTLLVLYPLVYDTPQPIAAVPETVPLMDMHYRPIEEPRTVEESSTVKEISDEMRVLGLDLPAERYRPGERVPVILYLQADQPVHEDYQLFIQLLDEEGLEIGNLTSHPGWGRHPTSLWQPGAIYRDPYLVLINRRIDNRSPLLAKVYVGFVDPATEKSGRFPIGTYDREGNAVPEPLLGHVTIGPATQPEVADFVTAESKVIPVGTQFGTVIQLSTVVLPDQAAFAQAIQRREPLSATLIWDVIGTPATDYTAFLHIIDGNGERVTGFDQAPAPRFPTSYWRVGDRIATTFPVPAPETGALSDYAIWIGLYEAESGGTRRLPVTEASGRVAGDGQVLVAEPQP